jgi:hypothetical protein
MKKILQLIILMPLFLCGCTKEQGEPYTIRFYGDAFEDIGYSVAIAPDGYLIAGQLETIARDNGVITPGSANREMAVIKTDWSGTVIWKTTVGAALADHGTKIYQLEDSSMLCVGTYTDPDPSPGYKKEILVAKFSPGGEVLWQKSYGGVGNQEGKDIVRTTDGFMILGTTDVERLPISDSTGNIEGNTDFLFTRIRNDGTFVETFPHGFPGNDDPSVIKADGSGNFMAFGTTDRSLPGQGGKNFILMQIYATSTTPGPTRILGTPVNEYGTDMEIMKDGGYLLVGTAGSNGSEQEGLVIRLKKNIFETPLFSSNLTLENRSTAINAISQYGSDSYVLAGYSGLSSASKMLVFEMDSDGNIPSGKSMIRGSTGEQLCYDVVSGDDGYVIAVGKNKYDINSLISFLKFKF